MNICRINNFIGLEEHALYFGIVQQQSAAVLPGQTFLIKSSSVTVDLLCPKGIGFSCQPGKKD
jgi:hypothetical protein